MSERHTIYCHLSQGTQKQPVTKENPGVLHIKHKFLGLKISRPSWFIKMTAMTNEDIADLKITAESQMSKR